MLYTHFHKCTSEYAFTHSHTRSHISMNADRMVEWNGMRQGSNSFMSEPVYMPSYMFACVRVCVYLWQRKHINTSIYFISPCCISKRMNFHHSFAGCRWLTAIGAIDIVARHRCQFHGDGAASSMHLFVVVANIVVIPIILVPYERIVVDLLAVICGSVWLTPNGFFSCCSCQFQLRKIYTYASAYVCTPCFLESRVRVYDIHLLRPSARAALRIQNMKKLWLGACGCTIHALWPDCWEKSPLAYLNGGMPTWRPHIGSGSSFQYTSLPDIRHSSSA